MRIVDSFLFSEVYEKELLLLKFILEDSGIHEWVIIENAYTFQGEYKGLNARRLIESDERFATYRHKISYIEKEQPTKVLPRHEVLDELSYEVEYWQRDLAQEYFLKQYDNEDWIMIADVDEMIDFTDIERKNELYDRLKRSIGLLVVPTKRYWFDFDNEYKLLISNTMCSKEYLVKTGKELHEIRRDNRKIAKDRWKHVVQFEYSTCYNAEHILRKFYTSTHTGFTPNDLEQSLRCNHRPVYEVRGTKPENSELYFFETVKLNETNSPKYVRENLTILKTNNIDINYKQNRRTDYPELFTVSHHARRLVKQYKIAWQKKFRYAVRKLKMEKLIYGSSVH
jgi:hypothetical protein